MLDIFNDTTYLHSVITIGSFIIFGIAIVGVLSKKNLIKIFLSLALAEASLFLFFIGNHFEVQKTAPIVSNGVDKFSVTMADPVPQAMILTTIVIAIAILALAISFVINYYKLSSNLDIDKMDEFTEQLTKKENR
ncbi:MAG: NADH-quinone oxidoreductase subunit K [Campylobacterota bacterium]|nr:NADH-quinone oxidoreductase subunit K [Campylobacterota bacterium]